MVMAESRDEIAVVEAPVPSVTQEVDPGAEVLEEDRIAEAEALEDLIAVEREVEVLEEEVLEAPEEVEALEDLELRRKERRLHRCMLVIYLPTTPKPMLSACLPSTVK